jgi:hypothetical protein
VAGLAARDVTAVVQVVGIALREPRAVGRVASVAVREVSVVVWVASVAAREVLAAVQAARAVACVMTAPPPRLLVAWRGSAEVKQALPCMAERFRWESLSLQRNHSA